MSSTLLKPRPPSARKLVLTILLCAVGCRAQGLRTEVKEERRPPPNILFILSDDHSANALGCYPSLLASHAITPNIDALAAEGARFTNCFSTNSICVPSRATILTGQYSHVNEVYSLQHALDPERQNVGKLLQEAGYQTALIGKWHLKEDPSGFDHWNILPGQGRYHDPRLRSRGEPRAKEYAGFSTDVITDLSIEWLEGRDPSRPFCLMTHFKNCHEPWDFAERHAELYAEVELPEPATLWEDKAHRSRGSRDLGFTIETMAQRMEGPRHATGSLATSGLSQEQRKRAAYQKLAKDYLRCVAAIDENVGRLVRCLKDEGILDDTLVLYTSDQGYFLGEHDYIDKRWMFEESLRMPFVARFPAEIEAGSTRPEMVLNLDFAQTLLDFAGAPPPQGMQGESFRDVLAGRPPDDWRTSMYYHYWQQCSRPAHYGIRTARYKLIFFHGVALAGIAQEGAQSTPSGWELYDLDQDPLEQRNVHADPGYAEVLVQLERELWQLKDDVGDDDARHPKLEAVSRPERSRSNY